MNYQWHITDRCDQKCKHCYVFNDPNFKFHEMSLDEAKFVIDKISKFQIMNNIVLTGGDPILYPYFWEVLEEINKKIKVMEHFWILGNPFHLTKEVIDRMAKFHINHYQISIDGLKETHDFIRKPGSFDATIHALELLHNSNVIPKIMMTISKDNMDQLIPVMEIAAKYNALFTFARFSPVDKITQPYANGIAPLEYRDLLDKVYNRYLQLRKEYNWTRMRFKDHLWELYFSEKMHRQSYKPYSLPMDGCHCGCGHMTILPTGDIMACRRIKNSIIGNIFNDELSDIWYKNLEPYRDYSKFEKCKDCPLLMYCRGCPAVAKSMTGNFYGTDPQCWRNISK